MKKFLILLMSLMTLNSVAQENYSFDVTNADKFWLNVYYGSDPNPYPMINFNDTLKTKFYTDTFDLTSINTFILNGNTNQYVRGNGSFATLPTFTETYTGTVTSVGLTSTDFTVSGSPVTTSGNITANLTTTGVATGTYDWVTVDTKGRVTAAGNTPLPTAIASGGRNFNQAYQLSSTRPSFISISAQLSCSLTLTNGQAGNVQLQLSANGSSGWVTYGTLTASNTGVLVVGLSTAQASGGQLTVPIPAGYYWRALTTNTTGTPTYTFNGGYEIIY